MENVVLVIHLILALSIIGLVLLQRSEGGGLGIGGGGGGMGGFASPQGTANALTKATAFCAIGFFCTSILLGILAGTHTGSSGILDELDQPKAAQEEQAGGTGSDSEQEPEVPTPDETPSVPIQ